MILALPAHAAETSEVLVLASAATAIPRAQTTRRAVEIQNLGPNAIFCAVGSSAPAAAAAAVVNKARKIGAGESWSLAAPYVTFIACRAATADQVTGAATIVTELR